eukprot:6313102-Prymnesium_polylepis.1
MSLYLLVCLFFATSYGGRTAMPLSARVLSSSCCGSKWHAVSLHSRPPCAGGAGCSSAPPRCR